MPQSESHAYTLKGCFEKALRRNDERTALRFGETDRTVTYAELDRRSNAVADSLVARGVTTGDRVALMMSNRVEYVVADLAVIKAGAVKVPLNDMLTADEFEYMLSDSRTTTVISGPSFNETLDELRGDLPHLERCIGIEEGQSLPEGFVAFAELIAAGNGTSSPSVGIEPSDTVAHYYTGGTTGKPKGVVHTNRNLAMNAYAHVIDLGITGDDTLLLTTPLPHSAGLFLWGGLLAGATMHICDGFEAERTLRNIETHEITWTFMVPTMIYRVLDHTDLASYDTSSIETLVYGASPMTSNRLKQGLDEFGAVFLQFYGQTEVPNLITTLGKQEHQRAVETGTEDRLKSAGRPCIMADVKVVDYDSGERLPAGEVGEILAIAPYTMSEYFERQEETSDTLVDGWVRTGDIGKIDDDGFVYLLDRDSDVIITGGMNVYSTEVEEVLDRHPDVREVAIIGVPHQEWGEAIHAVVVPDSQSLSETDIRAFADDHLAEYKKPKSAEFVEEIPKTPYGKQDKSALRDRHWEEEEREIS